VTQRCEIGLVILFCEAWQRCHYEGTV